jgi:serine/threonine protein kinase
VGLTSHPADKPPRLIPFKDVTHLVEIASGNFGKVFKGIFEGRLVVVKQPRATEAEAQLQEFNTLTLIPRHHHVLALIGGIIADNKQVWLVLPFMSGGSLEARMKREPTWGAVDPTRTRTAVSDMFDGLSHLHEQDILHNDSAWHLEKKGGSFVDLFLLHCGRSRLDEFVVTLAIIVSLVLSLCPAVLHCAVSPRNVLLDASEACLLCDFGLSKVTHKGADGSRYYTHKGGSLPVRWMAPECFGQSKRYTAKTDVWSLGVVIWQLLTGQELPYHEVHDGMDVVLGLREGSLDLRLSLPTAAIWSTLTALARQCLDRDPEKRPTAAQACARLRGSDMDSRPVRCRARGVMCFVCFAYVSCFRREL